MTSDRGGAGARRARRRAPDEAEALVELLPVLLGTSSGAITATRAAQFANLAPEAPQLSLHARRLSVEALSDSRHSGRPSLGT